MIVWVTFNVVWPDTLPAFMNYRTLYSGARGHVMFRHNIDALRCTTGKGRPVNCVILEKNSFFSELPVLRRCKVRLLQQSCRAVLGSR